MFGKSRHTTVVREDNQNVEFHSHYAMKLAGGCISFMGLILTLFFVSFFFSVLGADTRGASRGMLTFLLFTVFLIGMGLLFLLFGLKLLAPYRLTLDLITRRWNEQSGMLWWKRSREGNISDLLAIRYTPSGEDNPAAIALEWRDGRQTIAMGGDTDLERLAQNVTTSLNLHGLDQPVQNLPGQQVWTGETADIQTLKQRDTASMRKQGSGMVLFGSIWLAFTLLVGGALTYAFGLNWRIGTQGDVVQGRISSIWQDYSSEGKPYHISYEFVLPEGRKMTGQTSASESDLRDASRFNHRSFETNTPVDVEYLPHNPSYHRLRGLTYGNLSGSPVVGAVVLLLFIGVGVNLIKTGRKLARGNLESSSDEPISAATE